MYEQVWYVVNNGNWDEVPGSSVDINHLGDYYNVIVTVKGNEYTTAWEYAPPETGLLSKGSGYFIMPDKYASKFSNGGAIFGIPPSTKVDLIRINRVP